MDKIRIVGGAKLSGKVTVSGAKNAALPILFSTLLAPGRHTLAQVPRLKDIDSTLDLLKTLGTEGQRSEDSKTSALDLIVSTPVQFEAPYDLVRKMRASILCLGPLLARYQQAVVSLPGGCAIGTRPIDLHLEGLRAMGAEIEIQNGYVHASVAQTLRACDFTFSTTTVGGTENLLMAATLAKGETILRNCAREPEVVDLALYLRKMGALIEGEGTDTITIQGVHNLSPSVHTVMADRIEAGTLLIAGAITGGGVWVDGIAKTHLEALIHKMREAGLLVSGDDSHVHVEPNSGYQGTNVTTNPHPAFPTDLQAQFMALMCLCSGMSEITESVFENRFMHVQELSRLGANISSKGRIAVIRGVPFLAGADVMATDLRASACLVLAGLAARGTTTVHRIYHLDRGYERLEEKLRSLGAQIERTS